MDEHSVTSDIQKMHTRILLLEDLIHRIETQQKNSYEATEKILDECNKTIKEFDSQFDSSKYMKSSAGTGTTDREGGVKFDDEAGSEKEDVVNEGKKTSGEKSGDEETVDDIDLGF